MKALRLFVFFLFPLLVFGQSPRLAASSRPNTADLQKFLELSESQMVQLKQVQANRLSAAEVTYRDVTAKQKQLTELIASGSTDALAIGNLTIEVQRLRSRMIVPSDERDLAMAVLDSPQKRKLAELQQALNLRQAADQAAGFHLIEYPRVTVVIQK